MAGTAAGGNRRNPIAPYLLVAPGILWLIAFYVIPTLTLARTSVGPEGAAWYDGYQRAFTDYGVHLGRSFGYAFAATVVCVLLGYPLAYVIAFRSGRYKNFLLGLVILPFFTTFLVRTFAWKTILNDGGIVVQTLATLHLLPEEGRLLNTVWAVIGGLSYNFLPFTILPIYVSLEKIDRRLTEAANDLYCNAGQAFRKVVLPLSMPGVLAGSMLTFIPATGDFINAELLGSPNQKMLGSVIQGQFLQVRDYPLAAALSFVLMVIITIMVLAYARALGTEDLA
ncbi:MAG: ABC transporter permease [Gemmatimonadetes bacterium]|nr:ABC transporter permease [Gemmatimonadota bacterium]MBP9200982.1 ABC transporter permease [Gemmatimonadales bacterium]MBK6779626.1 ABC transporter permease [Gemmatimonadota bacterium]MBK7350350.1 ABC transporter permease [Gemmatimonadota bacterium]MBK7785493.1 ABC transporter permease [Gemmatimonadota bacterium]